ALGDNSGNGYKYYYCGLGGSAADFPAGVSGNIALIQRGTYNFSTKIHNAAVAGAIGAVIYNNAANGDNLVTMATAGETLPSVLMGRTGGLVLYAKSQNLGDGTGRVAFKPDTFADVPQAGDTMVDFSSWGPAPDLSFKPEITAPGGGIWSTVPVAQGSYANYSGTSMAAPHVGAAAGLLRQIHPNWQVSDIKTALMNTAKLIVDPSSGVYYSPHYVGAGRIDVNAAAKTPVLVTHWFPNGEIPMPAELPYVALGEQPNYKNELITFTLRLRNTSSNSVTYN
ncbi:MAG: S8 family serine peptidase, partial [Caldisericum sp.]|uniref:S8 family serine peptidase n=1 Tax=Caldisericum sp. TaxID=2499687 RepID=UPI003D0B0245